MVQEYEQKDMFGRFGKTVGEGLGEGLSRGVEQGARSERIAGGLEKASKGGAAKTPIQMYADLVRTTGMSPEEIQPLLPLIRQAMIAGEGSGDARPTGSTQPAVAPGMGGLSDSKEPVSKTTGRTATTSPGEKVRPIAIDEDYTTEMSARTREQIRAEGEDKFRRNPYRYPTVEAGIAEAQEEDNARVNRHEKAKNEYDTLVARKLQREGLQDVWRDVSEEIGQRIQLGMQKSIASGLDIGKAAQQASDIALKLAKDTNKLFELNSNKIFGRPSPALVKDLKQSRTTFDEVGGLEQFNDNLKSMGHNVFMASTITYPSEEVTEIVEKMPSRTKAPESILLGPISTASKAYNKSQDAKYNKAYEKTFDSISSNLKTSDSLHTIALALNDKGYDEMKFYDDIRDKVESGQLELSDRQNRELIEAQPVTFSLEDIFLGMFAFPGTTEKVPTYTKIKRTLFGKR